MPVIQCDIREGRSGGKAGDCKGDNSGRTRDHRGFGSVHLCHDPEDPGSHRAKAGEPLADYEPESSKQD